MIGFVRYVVTLTLCLTSVVSTRAADESATVKDAIRRHSEAVAQIRSYHVKIEKHSSHLLGLPDSNSLRFGPFLIGSDEADGRLVHESTTEIWQAGSQRHWIDRTFFSVGEKGVMDYGEQGLVRDHSLHGSSFRFLSGWDWEHPPAQVPLDIARSWDEVASVNCSISATDPIVIEDKSSMDRAMMYWDLLPGWSLAKVAEVCELAELPQSDSTVTRLQILSVPTPNTFATNVWRYVVGTLIDVGAVIELDHKHGWLISRFEGGPGPSPLIRRARQFRQTESGFWYVSEWEYLDMGRRRNVISIPICEVNQEFTQDKLQVQFPDGARVNDDVSGRIHIWGAGGPRESFSNSEDYLNYQKNYVIKLQRGGPQQLPAAKPRSATQWIIVVNVVLIAIIALFTYLRRRVSRKP